MSSQRWFLNPVKALQNRYRTTLDQIEQNLETKAISLPPLAPWTKGLTQIILVGIGAGVGWSTLARVDVVINASGKLEPLSQSQVIQSKVGGVVRAVLVREGQPVKQGQLLMQLDKTSLQNQMQALLMQRQQLVEETAVLRMADQDKSLEALDQDKTKIPPELMNRVQTRLLLVAQITGDASNLTPHLRQRYELFQQQLRDRRAISLLQESALQTQVAEADAKIAQSRYQLETEQDLLSRLQPLADQGAISRVNLLQRKVSVSQLQTQLTQNNLQKRQIQIGKIQARVEEGKLLNETLQDLQRQLAGMDTEFDTTIKDNQKLLIQVTSQLNQVKLDLKSQDLRAPVDGVVFNLGPKLPGVVAEAGQTLLQVVPDESLTARVQVANADIADVRVGMPVDIRVDAYSFTEYGSIKGVVSKVASESIKVSDQPGGATIFPVEVRLDRQFLQRKTERLPLTPGMSLVAMVKVRQRAPISYVTEELTKAFDGAKSVR